MKRLTKKERESVTALLRDLKHLVEHDGTITVHDTAVTREETKVLTDEAVAPEDISTHKRYTR